MEKYDPQKIELKWQEYWDKNRTYKNYNREKRFYVLDMFPYPSGEGLHVGHPKGYIATDVFARFKILQGYSVLHPMGFDSFGLPAENYAIKNKIHPKIAVEKNIATYQKQLKAFGFTYDWEREIITSDPEYYKWTQWIFLKMFEKGLAYESNEPVNWCPSCKTVLANEDLEKGSCERCGSRIVQKKLRQWVLKMTAYADRLLYDLDNENLNWEEMIKEQQRNWIGRSEGVQFEIKIKNSEEKIEVYTTRLDTVFGMTYAVVAPEHPILERIKDGIKNFSEIKRYLIQAQNKTELERMELQKEKTGVKLEGITAINPFTKEDIPLFVADYVLGFYGTGAVMAVPAHDERDFEFARKHNLPVKEVVKKPETKNEKNSGEKTDGAFTEDGILASSGEYSRLTSENARGKMAEWLEKNNLGRKKVNYKMRDWVFSRQRYWGEPIPIVHCEKCGTVAVPENELPLKLPEVKSYEPTGTGESPLANISEWVNTKCPKCGGSAKRETNTMPQWAGSCWYYLAYLMRGVSNLPAGQMNLQFPISSYKGEFDRWLPVDLYIGGIEHATRHLLYARFWHKFLYDLGVVSKKEPFKRLIHVGLVSGEDGRKMSKRWGNVVNPDDVISEFGADAMRLFEMFMGPFTQEVHWSTAGVNGSRRFLERVWKLQDKITNRKTEVARKKIEKLLHKTIKKVTEDIENFRFNTAISQLMILINEIEKEKELQTADCELLIIILSPFAPHIAEEMWFHLGHKESVFLQKWPRHDPALTKDEKINLAVQVNGKVRDIMAVDADISEDEAGKSAFAREKIKKWTAGKEIKQVIYIPGRIMNIVVG